MKRTVCLYAGLIAIHLGCGTVQSETLIPLIQEYQTQSGDYFVTVYKGSLSYKALAAMRSNSTILKQSKPALRSRIILRQSIEVQPGLVIPALPNLPEHTSVELQILTPISQEAEDLLTYLSLTVAP